MQEITIGQATVKLLEEYKKTLNYTEKENGAEMYLEYAINAVTLSEALCNEKPLAATIVGMLSEDYKQRLKAEYKQLKIRIKGLRAYIDKQEELKGESVIDHSELERLKAQLLYMDGYKAVLKERIAYIERD